MVQETRFWQVWVQRRPLVEHRLADLVGWLQAYSDAMIECGGFGGFLGNGSLAQFHEGVEEFTGADQPLEPDTGMGRVTNIGNDGELIMKQGLGDSFNEQAAMDQIIPIGSQLFGFLESGSGS